MHVRECAFVSYWLLFICCVVLLVGVLKLRARGSRDARPWKAVERGPGGEKP